jgi:hypothetical protein
MLSGRVLTIGKWSAPRFKSVIQTTKGPGSNCGHADLFDHDDRGSVSSLAVKTNLTWYHRRFQNEDDQENKAPM